MYYVCVYVCIHGKYMGFYDNPLNMKMFEGRMLLLSYRTVSQLQVLQCIPMMRNRRGHTRFILDTSYRPGPNMWFHP